MPGPALALSRPPKAVRAARNSSVAPSVAATFVGIIPGTFVYAGVGSGLGAVLEAGREPDLGLIYQPEILLPLLALAALACVPLVYKCLKARRRPEGE